MAGPVTWAIDSVPATMSAAIGTMAIAAQKKIAGAGAPASSRTIASGANSRSQSIALPHSRPPPQRCCHATPARRKSSPDRVETPLLT